MKNMKSAERTTKPPKKPAFSPESDTRTVKEIMQGLVDRLPDDCTWDDVLYKVQVCKKIAAGLRDSAEGRLFTEEEVYRDLEQ
jgi:hypothetical protein